MRPTYSQWLCECLSFRESRPRAEARTRGGKVAIHNSHRIQAFSREKALSCVSGSPVWQGSRRECIARSFPSDNGISSMTPSRETSSNLPWTDSLCFSLISFGITIRPCLSMTTYKCDHHISLPLGIYRLLRVASPAFPAPDSYSLNVPGEIFSRPATLSLSLDLPNTPTKQILPQKP